VPGRWVQIILDGLGIGEMPDADRFGDRGSNTLGNLLNQRPVNIPNLTAMGIGNITPLPHISPSHSPTASYGRMAEKSPAKDSTIGHWELAGVISSQSMPTYPQGFPPEIIDRFQEAIGRKVLGNMVASGTEIIQQLGDEHCRTGFPIVYTSADSVFQIAAHEDIIPVDELYAMCRTARIMLKGKHAVGRVIARPFVGRDGEYTRTRRRRDFSLPPHAPTLLDILKQSGIPTIGIGKIGDLFAQQGLSEILHTDSNQEGVTKILQAMSYPGPRFIFANLVDFDMLWGHRNDVEGYARGLENFDTKLPQILKRLSNNDVLVLTADHGNDPTTPSTDHSREYVPLLITGPKLKSGINLGTRPTFADLAATAAQYFGVQGTGVGTSFWKDIITQ
jgi:phosphopentomutase